VIAEIVDQTKADKSVDWFREDHAWPMLKNNLPKEMLNKADKIYKAVSFIEAKEKIDKIKPATKRMCLVINGQLLQANLCSLD